MLYIIGLGNPGKEYEQTRHNVAWILLDTMIDSRDWKHDKYLPGHVATFADMTLVKPDTFMNHSGNVIPQLMKSYGLSAETLLVVQDDIDLPLGTLRLSYDRGDGGHNGIKSIVEVLGSKQFMRLRVGVSLIDESGILRKPNVIGRFAPHELDVLKEVSVRFNHIIELIRTEGKEKAMNVCNTVLDL